MGKAIPTFMIPVELKHEATQAELDDGSWGVLPGQCIDHDPDYLPPGASNVFESSKMEKDYHEDAADIKRIFAQMYYGEVKEMEREIAEIAHEFPSLGLADWLHMWSKKQSA